MSVKRLNWLVYILVIDGLRQECFGISFITTLMMPFNFFSNCTVVPYTCSNDLVNFYLYNNNHREVPFKLMEKNIYSAPFNKNASIIVIIHGYTGNKDYSPNMELRPAFFENGEYNLITVDWSPGAREGCYAQAASNTDAVGYCAAKLLSKINIDHIIGFSLGAHVAGALGKYLRSFGFPVLWLTGLDPALPLFDPYTTTASSRLDSTDAEFVDVIHTNAGRKGRISPLGDIDFYVNGGTHQPGCNFNSSCDHVRAVEYYAETIRGTELWGTSCSMIDFVCMPNPASKDKQFMGFHVPYNSSGTYMVYTLPDLPFNREENISQVLDNIEDSISRDSIKQFYILASKNPN